MNFRLPIPSNWQDFERICHKLWIEIWNDPTSKRFGRLGQPQNGIDIYGTPIYTNQLAGVQCKDRDSNLGSKLILSELINECKAAKNFTPQIHSFTLATTSPRDVKIQKEYLQLNQKKTFPFNIDVWSWEDIQDEIISRPQILNHFYSELPLPIQDQSTIILNRYTSMEHFYAYFTRPIINNELGEQFKDYIVTTAYELSDNVYKHGHATFFKIIVKENKITFIDDGIEFNPLIDLDASRISPYRNVGSYVIKQFLDKYSSFIGVDYLRETIDGHLVNKLEITFTSDVININDNNSVEFNIRMMETLGRDTIFQIARSLLINRRKEEIILNLDTMYNLSAFYELIINVLSRLTTEQKLTVYIPRTPLLNNFNDLIADKRLKIIRR